MTSYSDDASTVNGEVEPVEIPAFLHFAERRRPVQAAASKPRRRVSPEMWGTFRAHLAREHQALPESSPRVRPTLARLKLLGKPALGSEEAA